MRVRAYAFAPGTPPAELRLWQRGANATDYGVHSWTERSAQLVGDDFATRGNRVALDVEHLGADPPNGAPPPTAGYATLELRDGEPWLVFDWSAYAVEQIQTRQRLYLSPEYVVERGEIVKLVRVSLVQDPATHNAPRLASNRAQTERTTVVLASRMRAGRNGMDPQTKAKALDALIAKDPEQCMAILKSIVVSDAGAEPDGDEAQTQAAAPPAAGDDPSKEPAQAPAQAAAPPPASDDEKKPVAASSAPTEGERVMAQRIAELEARDKARAAREAELEAETRVAAAGERIPESLRAWAKKLSKEDFDTFVKGLPEPSTGATGGVRASTKPARGETRPTGLPPAEKAALDQRMGLTSRASAIQRDGNRVAFGVMTREDAGRVLAAKKTEATK